MTVDKHTCFAWASRFAWRGSSSPLETIAIEIARNHIICSICMHIPWTSLNYHQVIWLACSCGMSCHMASTWRWWTAKNRSLHLSGGRNFGSHCKWKHKSCFLQRKARKATREANSANRGKSRLRRLGPVSAITDARCGSGVPTLLSTTRFEWSRKENDIAVAVLKGMCRRLMKIHANTIGRLKCRCSSTDMKQCRRKDELIECLGMVEKESSSRSNRQNSMAWNGLWP